MKTTTTNTRVLGTMSLIMCLGITTTGAAKTCSEGPGEEIKLTMQVDASGVKRSTSKGRRVVIKSAKCKGCHTAHEPTRIMSRGMQYSVTKVELKRVREWVEASAKAEGWVTASFCNCGAVFTVGNRQDDHGFHLMMKINEGGADITEAKDYNEWLSKTRGHNAFTENNVKLLVDEARYKSICGKRK